MKTEPLYKHQQHIYNHPYIIKHWSTRTAGFFILGFTGLGSVFVITYAVLSLVTESQAPVWMVWALLVCMCTGGFIELVIDGVRSYRNKNWLPH